MMKKMHYGMKKESLRATLCNKWSNLKSRSSDTKYES